MKFTLSWLKDHLDTEADLATLLDALTGLGLEVEGVEDRAAALAGFRVARVVEAAPHPQADKLQVLRVDIGEGAPLAVVCGAPNARAGLVGVLGLPGATVPANGMVLRVAPIRGITSNGMMCSSRELGLGDEHEGIIELPADAPVGTAYAVWAGLDDPVIDLAVTPNRPDCMGVRGIARDLAAAGLGTLKPLTVPAIAGTGACPVPIRIEDAHGCPVFLGRAITGLTNGPSPAWLQARLKAVGQRPISAVVDATNHLLIDLGRPAHAYDLARLTGGVVAREAQVGETLAALNGKTYDLAPGMTVIADEAGPLGLGGIMGGESSGVTETTTDILIEIAAFAPERIARTGQALNLTSDARQRFERGIDPDMLEPGMAILTDMIVNLCGGSPSGVDVAGEWQPAPRIIAYDPDLAGNLGGVALTEDRQQIILSNLGFAVEAASRPWRVTVPGWRPDIDGAADLVEDIVRMVGMDAVPSIPLPRAEGVAKPVATPAQKKERRLRRLAAARGFNELITWSFIGQDEARRFGGADWIVANPISEDMKAMRPSLLPGLLLAAARNQARGAAALRLFELGHRYQADGERLTLGLLLAGERQARTWREGKARGFDPFDLKAEMIELLAAAGAPVDNLQVMDGAGDAYHPGQSSTLRLGPKTVLAAFGALHPRLARAYDLEGPVMVGEVFVDAIAPARSKGRGVYAPPVLQAVSRDFAFLAPTALAADALVRAVKGADKAAITAVRLFDRFAGPGVPEGQVSLAVEVALQPADKSFTDAELTEISTRIVAAAAKLGAHLREG